jgi:hypothetical protein
MKAGPEVFLEHERLDVYRVALDFDALASKAVPRRGHRVLRDQLDRASIGIVLCIAEGAGRRSVLTATPIRAFLAKGRFWCSA